MIRKTVKKLENAKKLSLTRQDIKASTSQYLQKAEVLISKYFQNDLVVVQITQSTVIKNFVFFGINYVVDIVKKYFENRKRTVEIWAVRNKSIIKGQTPVIEIRGRYQEIIELEGIINGIIARGSSLATNSWKISQASKKEIIFMGDRQDHFVNHAFDGAAVSAGGINLFTTKKHISDIEFNKASIVGTMPHSIFAYCHGDIVKVGLLYLREFPNQDLILLVDYTNDVVNHALRAANFFKDKLFAIRIDLPPHLLAKSLQSQIKKPSANDYGGSEKLIKLLRKKLNANNHQHVKIILTSSVDYRKIVALEKANTPVDYYGVGKALLRVGLSFSANITKINGKPEAKAGKMYQDNQSLIRVL